MVTKNLKDMLYMILTRNVGPPWAMPEALSTKTNK